VCSSDLSEVSTIQLPVPGIAPVSLGDQDTWVATASVQQLLFSGGRVSSLVLQAGRGAEAARAARERARQAAAFGAERAFLLLLASQEESGVAERTLAAAESHLTVANGALAARAAARFDVLRAEVQVEEARQDVIRAGGARASAHAALLQALGLSGGEFRAVAPEQPGPGKAPRADPEAAVADAVRLRPDLAGLQRQVEAAEAGVAAARAERFPTLSALADYRYANPESQLLFSRWSVGASLSLPVLDGGRIAARRAEAEAALAQAAAARDAQQRAVESEVRQAAARLASADEQVLVAERRATQAEELLRIAEVRYAGGAGTATEIADAQASLARARYGRTRARAEQGIAAAELAFAVGTTATEPAPAGDATREGLR
jgi:outer membrane protein TolC